MHVIAAKAIKDYAEEYSDASTWLMTFLERAEAATWTSINDVRRVYPHADPVKVSSGNDVIVLNACGNKYRLITAIHFNRGKLYILRFMPHSEYDKDLWKDQL
jgi:mRNA interferase HigB